MYHLTKQLRWNAFSTLHFCHLKVNLGQRCALTWWIGVIVRDMHSMNGSKLATKNDFIRIGAFFLLLLRRHNLIMKFTQSWTYGVRSMEQRAIRYSTMKNIITMAKCSPHLIKTMITTVGTRLTLLYSERCLAAGNCAFYYKSGWWFDSCFAANLNGKYYESSYNGNGIRDGIYWGKWKELRDKESQNHTSFKVSFWVHYKALNFWAFQYVDMKIRPRDFKLIDLNEEQPEGPNEWHQKTFDDSF